MLVLVACGEDIIELTVRFQQLQKEDCAFGCVVWYDLITAAFSFLLFIFQIRGQREASSCLDMTIFLILGVMTMMGPIMLCASPSKPLITPLLLPNSYKMIPQEALYESIYEHPHDPERKKKQMKKKKKGPITW